MKYLDVYDNSGNKTGRVIVSGDKTVVSSDDEHIALSVIFIENDDNEFLMQKTSLEKGGLYSSTGGHVDSGETPLEAIIREVLEELGIDISHDPIEELGYLLYDKPLRYIFYLRKNINVKEVTLQKLEVDYVEYMTIQEINNLIEQEHITKSHGVLFKKVLELKK